MQLIFDTSHKYMYRNSPYPQEEWCESESLNVDRERKVIMSSAEE